MAGTNRYMNYGPFSFATTAVTGIKSFSANWGVSTKAEAGDSDGGPTSRVIDFMEPAFNFTTLNAMALQAAIGTRGVFLATLFDAYNKGAAGGGGTTFTTNALSVLAGADISSSFREYATRQFTVHTTWVDGVTFPVSVAAL